MKKSLLATVAAAALFAGTGLAMAEGVAKDKDQGGGAQMQRGAEPKGGAEMKPDAEQKGAPAMKGKARTTGQGAGTDTKADSKAGVDVKPSTGPAQRKAGQAEPKAGQAEPKPQAQTKEAPAASKTQAQDTKQAPASRTQAQDSKSQPAAKSAQDSKSGTATTGQGAATGTQAGGAVNLTTEQKTQIRTTVLQGSSVPRVQRSSISFNINVGTVVPRTVHYIEVPDTLIRIHPAWRGYRYFVVEDEIIIVDPVTLKIVAVLYV